MQAYGMVAVCMFGSVIGIAPYGVAREAELRADLVVAARTQHDFHAAFFAAAFEGPVIQPAGFGTFRGPFENSFAR